MIHILHIHSQSVDSVESAIRFQPAYVRLCVSSLVIKPSASFLNSVYKPSQENTTSLYTGWQATAMETSPSF